MKRNVRILGIVLFLLTMTTTGTIYKLLNYSELDTNVPKELTVAGVSLVVSFFLSLLFHKVILKKKKKKKEDN